VDRNYLVNFDTRQLPQEEWEYVIIGSGIAGLYSAYIASRCGGKVVVLTKHTVLDSNTDKAQGGIAAALDTADSPDLHLKDTLAAGAGLCDYEAVNILVNEGPQRVAELINLGAHFDQDNGKLLLGREGAHSRRRILHAAGDATGAEIQRVLTEYALNNPSIDVRESHFVVDLLVRENTCYGVLAYDRQSEQLKIFWSRTVILASGGVGQLYKHSTNPEVATADGIAIAYRAGVEVMDMEFIQFHPTALNLPEAPRFLISEAARGEGACLLNRHGDHFMARYHPMAELAPRDIIVRAILQEMKETESSEVYLDLSMLGAEKIFRRFPNITSTCSSYGLDVIKDPIPVAPAAHYMMGGVKTNLYGETSIIGLYACGEVACQGVHGANRLASNSLLDGVVFGQRIIERKLSIPDSYKHIPLAQRFFYNEVTVSQKNDYVQLKHNIQSVMEMFVGPIRTGAGLLKAIEFFEEMEDLGKNPSVKWDEMEVCNMLQVAQLITEAALMRTESRGGHFRQDFPNSLKRWRKHIILKRG
jgi:L-aspartate oxidase